MKTHFKKMQNPNYIGSWDLVQDDGTFKEISLQIKQVKKEMVHDGKGGTEECTVVHFLKSKPMVCNSTNLKMIAKVLGSNFIEDWQGQSVVIGVEKVKAFGEIHDALRVRNKKATKPELTAEHPNFESAKKAIAGGTYTIADVKAKYSISPEVEALLQKGASK